MSLIGPSVEQVAFGRAIRWLGARVRFVPLGAVWAVTTYYCAIWILALAPWSALLLAMAAWIVGIDFLNRFAAVTPMSFVLRGQLWLTLHVLWPPVVGAFIVRALAATMLLPYFGVIGDRWGAPLTNVAAAAVAAGLYHARARRFTLPLRRHYRGRKRLEAAPTAEMGREHAGDPRAYRWGGVTLPGKALTDHSVFVGVHGSGKTLSIRMLLQQQLPQIRRGSNSRALIYDADMDMIPYLASLKRWTGGGRSSPLLDPAVPVVTLNPFDTRCYAWDIAGDVTTDATAYEVATILFPTDKADHDKFFGPTATQIARRVMVALHYNNPGKWTFKDLVDALQTEQDIRRTLESCPRTARYVDTYLSPPSMEREDRQARGIVATVGTQVAVYEPVAALWEKALQEEARTGQRRRISFKEWSENSMILLLGTYDARAATLGHINQVLFNLAAKYVLSQPVDPTDQRRSLFVIDEVRRIEKLDKLSDLLTNGRKRGAAVVLGFQDIEGLRHAYQSQIAHEVIGQCGNVAFFRLTDETARWAESFIGVSEELERTFGDHGRGFSVSEGIHAHPLVMASELSSLPKAGPENGLHGYYITQYADGVFPHHTEWHEIAECLVDPASVGLSDDERQGFIKRDDEAEQYDSDGDGREFLPPGDP